MVRTYTTVTRMIEIAIAFGRFLKKIVIIMKYFPLNILDRILQLLDDKVEIIPSIVSKQTGIEGECNLRQVCLSVVPVEIFSFSCKYI